MYYLSILGKDMGPFTLEELQELAKQGRLAEDTAVKVDGKTIKAGEIEGIRWETASTKAWYRFYPLVSLVTFVISCTNPFSGIIGACLLTTTLVCWQRASKKYAIVRPYLGWLSVLKLFNLVIAAFFLYCSVSYEAERLIDREWYRREVGIGADSLLFLTVCLFIVELVYAHAFRRAR